jgi:hypothetical protein
MIVINLAHPLTAAQQAAIETGAGQAIERLIERMAQFDPEQAFAGQARRLVDDLGLTPAEWQQAPLLVVLPGLNFGAATVLAELHGRCGYFPAVVRLRPVEGSLPPRYELAEIINLQAIRDTARQQRLGGTG